MLASVAVFLVMFLIGYLFYSQPRRRSSGSESNRRQENDRPVLSKSMNVATAERVWMQKLMEMTRGNTGAIERGVTARRRTHPRASRAEILEMVYRDYLKDRS